MTLSQTRSSKQEVESKLANLYDISGKRWVAQGFHRFMEQQHCLDPVIGMVIHATLLSRVVGEVARCRWLQERYIIHLNSPSTETKFYGSYSLWYFSLQL
ncbi:hypothetical protein H6F74_28960 [Trichocoleus sp. FACHB-90]|uniref:hypothetical protein n=1 Tax=Cyanophyceae TaxID=3028117 RepID=UPI001688C04E|nr:hypothetical protein [Trichocoleus sp. FACHB-90]MBD1930218.1 hypothetical protein [Trichocoleus sp. FACHB-90]